MGPIDNHQYPAVLPQSPSKHLTSNRSNSEAIIFKAPIPTGKTPVEPTKEDTGLFDADKRNAAFAPHDFPSSGADLVSFVDTEDLKKEFESYRPDITKKISVARKIGSEKAERFLDVVFSEGKIKGLSFDSFKKFVSNRINEAKVKSNINTKAILANLKIKDNIQSLLENPANYLGHDENFTKISILDDEDKKKLINTISKILQNNSVNLGPKLSDLKGTIVLLINELPTINQVKADFANFKKREKGGMLNVTIFQMQGTTSRSSELRCELVFGTTSRVNGTNTESLFKGFDHHTNKIFNSKSPIRIDKYTEITLQTLAKHVNPSATDRMHLDDTSELSGNEIRSIFVDAIDLKKGYIYDKQDLLQLGILGDDKTVKNIIYLKVIQQALYKISKYLPQSDKLGFRFAACSEMHSFLKAITRFPEEELVSVHSAALYFQFQWREPCTTCTIAFSTMQNLGIDCKAVANKIVTISGKDEDNRGDFVDIKDISKEFYSHLYIKEKTSDLKAEYMVDLLSDKLAKLITHIHDNRHEFSKYGDDAVHVFNQFVNTAIDDFAMNLVNDFQFISVKNDSRTTPSISSSSLSLVSTENIKKRKQRSESKSKDGVETSDAHFIDNIFTKVEDSATSAKRLKSDEKSNTIGMEIESPVVSSIDDID